MSLPIIFRSEARFEFDEAHDFYEAKHAGLGEQFSQDVRDVLKRIAANPQMHQCVLRDIRRAVVQGWPYTVMYRVLPKRIRVIAVFHASRDPKIWQSRT